LLAAAAGRGLCAVMLEGGPRLAASFLSAGCVDTWVQYIAPTLLGAGVGWPEVFPTPESDWYLRSAQRVGSDLRLIWDRRSFAATLQELTTERARALRIAAVTSGSALAGADGEGV
jgi:hypothetical protein